MGQFFVGKDWYGSDSNKTSLKWLTVAMPLLETSKRLERQERDYRETRNMAFLRPNPNTRYESKRYLQNVQRFADSQCSQDAITFSIGHPYSADLGSNWVGNIERGTQGVI